MGALSARNAIAACGTELCSGRGDRWRRGLLFYPGCVSRGSLFPAGGKSCFGKMVRGRSSSSLLAPSFLHLADIAPALFSPYTMTTTPAG